MSIARVVAVTGCDSGLGWAIAARLAREGLITVAGMFQGTDTKAAEALRKLKAHPYPLDVTNTDSIDRFKKYVNSLIEENPGYRLHAIVNNAGIMIIGNFEWHTPAMIENIVNINLLGPMRVASAFLPDLRRSASENPDSVKPRVINVASHCGLQPLPAFGPYGASKAAVLTWTKALRLEYRNLGITALAFVPGGFVTNCNLMAYQVTLGKTMLENLNEEQKLIYEKKIIALCDYFTPLSEQNRYDSLKDEYILETFTKAITDKNPKSIYKVENWRYKFYYNLLKLPLPEFIHHWLIKKFLNFPSILYK